MEHSSVNDTAMCISLFTSATVKGDIQTDEQKRQSSGMQESINVMSINKYLGNFWTLKYFGHFLDDIFISIGLRNEKREMSESYTTKMNAVTQAFCLPCLFQRQTI